MTGIYVITVSGEIRECVFVSTGLTTISEEVCSNPNSTITNYYSNNTVISILCLTNVIFLMIAKYIFYIIIYQQYKKNLKRQVTSKDYTLLMKFKRKTLLRYESPEMMVGDFVNMLRVRRRLNSIEILKVSPVYTIKDFSECSEKLQKLETALSRKKMKGKNVDKLEKEFLVEQTRFIELRTDVNLMKNERFSGWMFVTFNTPRDRESARERVIKVFNYFIFGNEVRVLDPPDATDIKWENWGVSIKKRVFRRMTIVFGTIGMIIVTFVITLSLKYAQTAIVKNHIENKENSSMNTVVVSVVISIVINAINIIVKFFVVKFTDYEVYKTRTSHDSSIVLKLVTFNFINKGLVLLFTNFITSPAGDWGIFGLSGVGGNILISMILGVFIDSFLLMIDPVYFFKLFKQRSVKKSINQNKIKYLQCEANEIFELIEFRLSELYAMFFECICLAFFYQALIPYGLLFGAVELSIKYFAAKYVLIRRSNAPLDLSFSFTIQMFKLFELAVLLLPFGYMTFFYIFRQKGQSLSIYILVALILAAIEFVFGILLFSPYYTNQVKKDEVQNYLDLKLKLRDEYDLLNPMTRNQAKSDIRQLLRKERERTIGRKSEEKNVPQTPSSIDDIDAKVLKEIGQNPIYTILDENTQNNGKVNLSQQNITEEEKFRKSLRNMEKIDLPQNSGFSEKIKSLKNLQSNNSADQTMNKVDLARNAIFPQENDNLIGYKSNYSFDQTANNDQNRSNFNEKQSPDKKDV